MDRSGSGRSGVGGEAGRRGIRLKITEVRLSQQVSKARKKIDQGRGSQGGEGDGSADTRGSYRDGRAKHPIVHYLRTEYPRAWDEGAGRRPALAAPSQVFSRSGRCVQFLAGCVQSWPGNSRMCSVFPAMCSLAGFAEGGAQKRTTTRGGGIRHPQGTPTGCERRRGRAAGRQVFTRIGAMCPVKKE